MIRIVRHHTASRRRNLTGAASCRRCSSVLLSSSSPQRTFLMNEWRRGQGASKRTFSASPENTSSGMKNQDEDEFSAPWKTLLEMPARASWRVASARLPEPLATAQAAILKTTYRTKKQLHRTYQEVMESHKSLAGRRERERERIVGNNKYKPRDKTRDEKVQPVFYGPEETLAAFNFRLHANYSVTKRVLDECKSLVGRKNWDPKRVIDFGVGCGSASAAAMAVWDDIEWIHGIDPSETMREGAQTFLDDVASQGKRNVVPRITLAAHLSVEASSTPFDLALCAYTATELPNGASTLAAAAILWGKLRPGGIFVMVEPGTPDGFSSIRTVRNMLLDCCPPNGEQPDGQEECHILAPCTHNGSCPMDRFSLNQDNEDEQDDSDDGVDGDGDNNSDDEEEEDEEYAGEDDYDSSVRTGFCSFVQTMPGGKARSKGEKFSYIVVQKRLAGKSTESPHQFDDVNLTELLLKTKTVGKQRDDSAGLERLQQQATELESRFLDSDDDNLGLEFLRGDENRSSYGRIINAPKKRKGHVHIDSCTGPGRIVTHVIPKSLSKSAPGIYAAARKSRWGGYWPDLDIPIK